MRYISYSTHVKTYFGRAILAAPASYSDVTHATSITSSSLGAMVKSAAAYYSRNSTM